MFRKTSEARTVVLAGLLLATTATSAQAPTKFDSNRAWEHLRQLVALGPRPAGSPAIDQARAYIKKQLADIGVTATEQVWDDSTPLGPVHMINLIARIPGASGNRLVIAAHYDTKRVREFPFVGANDGGSSAAFLIELARVLKTRKNPLTLDLVFFDGEEAVVEWQGNDRVYGSRHFVADAKRTNSLASVKAMILVDMIADRDLVIRRDLNSTAWLTNAIWTAAAKQNLSTVFSSQPTDIDDDHVPFLQAGIPSVDIIDLDYGPWHTAGDTLDACSARSLQTVGDVLLAALPDIEARLR